MQMYKQETYRLLADCFIVLNTGLKIAVIPAPLQTL